MTNMVLKTIINAAILRMSTAIFGLVYDILF